MTTRMRVTITFEYDADPENYPDPTPKAMAKLDSGNDPGDLLSMLDGEEVTMTIVPLETE